MIHHVFSEAAAVHSFPLRVSYLTGLQALRECKASHVGPPNSRSSLELNLSGRPVQRIFIVCCNVTTGLTGSTVYEKSNVKLDELIHSYTV
jgi:hypothetical protein